MEKGAAKRITRTITTEEEDDDDAAATGATWDEAPIFASGDRRSKKLETIAVHRREPDSGYLGVMPLDVSEATLAATWGGGSYKLEGKNALGQVVKDAVRTVKLAGDPIFSSELEEKRWRKANGLRDIEHRDAGALSVKDLFSVIEEKDEKRRTEQLEREDRARKEVAEREAHERQQREERDARAQKDADEREERRRREAREDDERRSRTHREDMERLNLQNAAALSQTQQFFNQLVTTMKADEKAAAHAPDPIKTLLAGMQIAREMGGAGGEGGPADFLTTLIGRLPETLAEVRKTAAGAYAELTGKRPAAVPKGADYLTITGPTATKAKQVIRQLANAGKDPEAELNRILSFAAAATAPSSPPTSAKKVPAAVAPAAAAAARRAPRRAKASTGRPSPAARKARPARRRGAAA